MSHLRPTVTPSVTCTCTPPTPIHARGNKGMLIGDDHEDNKHDYDDRGHNDSRSNLNSHQIPPRVFKLNIQSVFNLVSNVEYDGSDNEFSSFLL